MYVGQVIVIRYNGIHNAKLGEDKRNLYALKDFDFDTIEEYYNFIADCFDEIPVGNGYVLANLNRRMIMYKDCNNVKTNHHSINYHPLSNAFCSM